ncbi:uncharacterized protein LOC134755209 [Cydia strobilella]|uniref:uncharacterized protein LOC134755209 n=2 Tax=Cydia strobilella TaxID=1100964 RepID=UPI003005A892
MAPSHCKVLQVNLQHSESATAQLRRWLEVNPTSIALIQEPWIRNTRINGLCNTGGNLVYNTHYKPRSCIYISRNIMAQPLTQFCSRDVCAIKLLRTQNSSLPEIVLASTYMAAEDEPPPVEMNNLIRYCERERLELVISADCNGHHNLWGMETNNKRAQDWQLNTYPTGTCRMSYPAPTTDGFGTT